MTPNEKMMAGFNRAMQSLDNVDHTASQVPPDAEYTVETVLVGDQSYQVLVARLLINPKRLSQTKKSLILTEASNDDTGWGYPHGDGVPEIVFSGMAYISVE